jgi:hypothetical protein
MRSCRGHLKVVICGCWAVALILVASGCASKLRSVSWRVSPAALNETSAFSNAEEAVRQSFPPAFRATQRAIITVRRRQFVCDAFLKVSPAEGWHLALASTLGLVSDLRVRPDGVTEILKATPLLREEWAREYVAQELRWLFVPPSRLVPAGRLNDGRLVLEESEGASGCTRRYLCRADGSAWEELEVLDGKGRRLHARISSHRVVPGWPHAVPIELEADAGVHQLHLRVGSLDIFPEVTP